MNGICLGKFCIRAVEKEVSVERVPISPENKSKPVRFPLVTHSHVLFILRVKVMQNCRFIGLLTKGKIILLPSSSLKHYKKLSTLKGT